VAFLTTSDGLIAERSIIAIGNPENWPHGVFHKVTYQVGAVVHETRACAEDVEDFLE
jgi:hypothetical protein